MSHTKCLMELSKLDHDTVEHVKNKLRTRLLVSE